MTLVIEPDPDAVAQKGAAIFSRIASKSVASRGAFAVALSGGSTPRPMNRMLREEPYLSTIPWVQTNLFWVDERCVPVHHPASNYGAATVDFLGCVPIPETQVHPMPAHLPPQEGAAAYQKELVRWFRSQAHDFPVFDLIFLGIGTDGHTASLFPLQNALSEKERLVVPVRGGEPQVARLTMTFSLINNAREVVFLVSGREKGEILKAIIQGPPDRFPAQMVRPLHGNLTWLMDREAASQLDA
jgi:6-phosphogluconolactonase